MKRKSGYAQVVAGVLGLVMVAGCPNEEDRGAGKTASTERPAGLTAGAADGGGSTKPPPAAVPPPTPAPAASTAAGAPTPSAVTADEVMTLEEHYPNGALRIRREVKRTANNVIVDHGSWVEYDENGQKMGDMSYVNGKLHGPITLWHPNGQKQGEGFFEDGEKEGTWQIWDEQGRKIREESHKDNLSDGMWIYWDEEGNVIQYEHWVKGERQLETNAPASPASKPAAPTTAPAASQPGS